MNSIKTDHFEKHENGTITKDESVQLHGWYIQFGKAAKPLDNHQIFKKSLKRMDHIIVSHIKDSGRKNKWNLPAAAAILIVAMSVTFYFISYYPHPAKFADVAYTEIAPGQHVATLQIVGGKKIEIGNTPKALFVTSDGTIVSNDGEGMLLYKKNNFTQSDIEYHIIKVPKGGQYGVCLPDGTKVWLNAASTLKYPSSFSSLSERRVTLSGEAYFDVYHQQEKPFIVETSDQIVRDIGTEFNINSYKDESGVKTTLIDGSLGITLKKKETLNFTGNSHESILKPGEEALLVGEKIQIRATDVAFAIAWKNGVFKFRGDDLNTALRKLSRWYNIDVTYNGTVPKVSLDGTIPNNIPLAAALKILLEKKVEYSIRGRTVVINSGG